MSAPLTDLHLQYVIKLGLKTIRANPDKHLKDIFGEHQSDHLAAVYGNRTLNQAAEWIKKTEVPVILGFDLTEARMPAVTIHLSSSAPSQPLIGDESIGESEDLGYEEKEVLVPAFQPASMNTTNPASYIITLPSTMPFDQQELFLAGLNLRDSKNREYVLDRDDNGNILVKALSSDAPLAEIDTTHLEVVSPVIQARFSRGSMIYQETATIAIHGIASRQEGLWLYYMVMWTLLKFRPVLTGLLGLDLSMPRASDYSKDDGFLGENVWRRFITVEATTSWSWEQARQKDILGMLLSVHNGSVDNSST